MSRKTRASVLVSAIALAVTAAACSPGSSEPDVATWLEKWDAIVDVVPEQDTIAAEPDPEFCKSILSQLRTESADLLPSPNLTVDDLVRDWIEVAEGAFFECPPSGEEIGSFSDAYAELDRIEKAVTNTISN